MTGPGLKKARRRGVDIVFFDEFGFSFQEPLARTWAPKGKRPVVRRIERERRSISTAVGLTLSGKIYKRHFPGGMKSPQVIEALEHIHRYLPNGFILIWDRGSIHTSAQTEAYLAAHPEIIVEPLPSYAPELNPEEYCHGNAKQHLKNATPNTKGEVCHLLDREFARLRHRPDLLLHFIHHAGLSVRQLW
ncbi:MAG: transposase [Anaerolineae bacterium]